MDKKFHPIVYLACDYLSMLGLKLNHVSKMGAWWVQVIFYLYFSGLWQGHLGKIMTASEPVKTKYVYTYIKSTISKPRQNTSECES